MHADFERNSFGRCAVKGAYRDTPIAPNMRTCIRYITLYYTHCNAVRSLVQVFAMSMINIFI